MYGNNKMNNIKTTIDRNNNENLILDIEEGIMDLFNHFDVLISDFDEKKISSSIASLLDVSYLSKATMNPTFPVFGRIHGRANRLFVNFAVRFKQHEPVNVIFLVDPGSPLTYLTDSTFTALLGGSGTFEGQECEVNIHGNLQEVRRSDLPEHHFKGINLLGADYLKSTSLVLTADYANDKVKLERTTRNIGF